jgi:hypothetical protein
MMEKSKRGDLSSAAIPSKCPACGGTQFERGVQVGGYQKLDQNGNIPTFSTPKALAAFRCENCNRVELYVDPEMVKSLRQQKVRVVFATLGIIALIYGVLGIIFFIVTR